MSITFWFLLIDHKCIPIGSAGQVTVPGTFEVADLRTKVKEEEFGNMLDDVDANRLTVFERTDSSIDLVDHDEDGGDEGMVPNKVKRVFSDKKVKKLSPKQTIASLQMQNDTLIVQLPGGL